jgi:hypothetical protein
MSQSECQTAIEAFASADPTRLQALPAGCTLADAEAVLHSLGASSRGMLGSRSTALEIRYFSSPKLAEIHAWIDSAGRVVLLDADRPPASAAEYLAALGEPDARLDYPWHGSPLPGAELVWTKRGAVLVSSSQVTGVVRVGAFAPVSLARYQSDLRYLDVETDDGARPAKR